MEKRNDTLRFLDAEVRLFLEARCITTGQTGIACDRLVVLVQGVIGHEDDVVIYKLGGKRRVGQLRMLVASEPCRPPLSVSTDFNEAIEDISPEEEKRLLAVYDKFATRTWVQ